MPTPPQGKNGKQVIAKQFKPVKAISKQFATMLKKCGRNFRNLTLSCNQPEVLLKMFVPPKKGGPSVAELNHLGIVSSQVRLILLIVNIPLL